MIGTLHRVSVVVTLVLACGRDVAAASPTGGFLLWQSGTYEDGDAVVLIKSTDEAVVRTLTPEGGAAPVWSPDGRWVSYVAPDYSTHLIRPDGTGDKVLCVAPESTPGLLTRRRRAIWPWDNSGVTCPAETTNTSLIDPETGEVIEPVGRTEVSTQDGVGLYAVSRDRRWFVRTVDSSYVSGFPSYGLSRAWSTASVAAIFDAYNGADLWPVMPSEPFAAASPDGHTFFFSANSVTFGRENLGLYRIDVGDRQQSLVALEVGNQLTSGFGWEFEPAVSNDGHWLTFVANPDSWWVDDVTDDPAQTPAAVIVHEIGTSRDSREILINDGRSNRFPGLFVGELWGEGSPRMSLSPNIKTLHRASMDAAAEEFDVRVHNLGAGTLGAVDAEISYTTGGEGWLAVVPTGTGNDQFLHTHVDTTAVVTDVISRATVIVIAAGSDTVATYDVVVQVPLLETIRFASQWVQIDSGGTMSLSVSLRNQYGGTVAAPVEWSLSGGGTLAATDDASKNESTHSVTFISDGSAGTFEVRAHHDSIVGLQQVIVLPRSASSSARSSFTTFEAPPACSSSAAVFWPVIVIAFRRYLHGRRRSSEKRSDHV